MTSKQIKFLNEIIRYSYSIDEAYAEIINKKNNHDYYVELEKIIIDYYSADGENNVIYKCKKYIENMRHNGAEILQWKLTNKSLIVTQKKNNWKSIIPLDSLD
ncbi:MULTISPECIES: hypothetical protein [unclassified Clostridium]|uniref:hypothetical protein n=1 Tax=unclassified Clostridium TaxID=2614128 RepID=UPI0025C21E55|nr:MULTISPECIES: hypothetical protein [unclassified Clostridium]